jgi:hypothetical protein
MSIDTKLLEQLELEHEVAHAQFSEGLLAPTVGDDSKLLAAAIALAGSEIALSIVRANERSVAKAA